MRKNSQNAGDNWVRMHISAWFIHQQVISRTFIHQHLKNNANRVFAQLRSCQR